LLKRSSIAGTRSTRVTISDMAWAILLVAASFEIGWAVGLKYTNGFTRLWPTVGTVVALVLSVALLAFATRTLPIGTAYAVWTGIGAAGTALFGIWLFQEPATAERLLCIALIVGGVVGLKWAS
jgi:quaternary ammonium compound-resistance protein SugE